MKSTMTFLITLALATYAAASNKPLGGSVNNGNGEAEKKLQQIYSQPTNLISIDSSIKDCINSSQCASSKEEIQHWKQLLSFIANFRSQQPRLSFEHPYFQHHPDAYYYIDSNDLSPLFFNAKTLYLSQESTLPLSSLVEILCLALQEKANISSKDFQNYLCYKLEIFISK